MGSSFFRPLTRPILKPIEDYPKGPFSTQNDDRVTLRHAQVPKRHKLPRYVLREQFNLGRFRTRFVREITPRNRYFSTGSPCCGDPMRDSHADFTVKRTP